ncbi:pyroglutamyl-peptidase I [Lysobacter enzymogenes]|uniref:Pyrrolidone-carboxylate peptidase n=1 Tax=Lysobacter enzymogenes TaxID=69 RepID=A0AAU9AP30_LYSEN|nr:pyroglutamyl-peptidase I [Lysobacter enzymogenes]BAV97389.1 pyrrolidone-carboxylate peptidase [Lysobacter enzymogenes]
MTSGFDTNDFDRAPVLLTGFAAFGGESDNPSWEAVRRLDGERIGGRRVVADCLPVAFGASLQRLRERLDALRPALVLCIGQAGGRAQLSIERIAINVDDARIADNLGAQPIDTPVIAGGPAAYFSSLPIKALRAAVNAAGVPAEISQTAGTYVCNHVFYGLMHELALRGDARVRGGFIHIPYSPAQAARQPGAPSLDLDSVARALRTMIATALTTEVDHRLAGGAEH